MTNPTPPQHPADDAPEGYGEHAGPQNVADEFPAGTRVRLRAWYGRRVWMHGTVTGTVEARYEVADVESGPTGHVEDATLLVVACDDGRERRVHPGDAEPTDQPEARPTPDPVLTAVDDMIESTEEFIRDDGLRADEQRVHDLSALLRVRHLWTEIFGPDESEDDGRR